MVTTASPLIFSRACIWMTCDHVNALKKPSFRRKGWRFGLLKLRFPPSSRLQWSCTQLLPWCLVCWAGSERFASAWFPLRSRRQRGLKVYLSIWENASLGKLGILSVTWRNWDAMQEENSLRFRHFVRILPDDFSLRRLFANFSVCHKLLDLFSVISETNTFRQGKVVISKSASLFW